MCSHDVVEIGWGIILCAVVAKDTGDHVLLGQSVDKLT